MGMVFLPLLYDEAQVIEDVSPNDFSDEVYKRFGVKLAKSGLRYENPTK
jgi:hypothetical protein